MAFELIQDNFVAVAITSFLILFIVTNNNFEKRINNLFLSAAACVLVLIVEEAWEAQLALSPTYEPLRVPLSAIGYALRPLVPFLLVQITKSFSKKRLVLLSLPLVFNTLVSFSALFCGISFSYSADNKFVRGPLGVTPFVVAAIYICFVLVLTLSSCEMGSLTEAMIISAIVLLAFLSTILESIFHFQFIQNPSIATSITFYYLFLHSNRNNRDALTGSLTRRRFYIDSEKYKQTLSAVISVDLNNLKELNDIQGHVAGDKALITVAKTMGKYTGSKVSLYRIGGDEFMLLCYRMKEKHVIELISKIRADLEKTEYRCAIGYAICLQQSLFDSACQKADEMMYEDKRKMKALPPLCQPANTNCE